MDKCLACTQIIQEQQERKNSTTQVENDFLRQERDELRAKVDELAKEVADLKDGQYAAMEQTTTELELKNYRLNLDNELLAQEVEELKKKNHILNTFGTEMLRDIGRLTEQAEEIEASRDFWREKAERYKKILTGRI